MKLKNQCISRTVLLLIVSFYLINYALAESSRHIAEKTFPSTVMLIMYDKNGSQASLGSGFFVSEDIVATNLHVIKEASGGIAKIIGKKQKYDILGYVALNHQMDLVLLKIQNVTAPVLSLEDSNDLAIGDEVYAVGNPQGLEGTFSKGIISGIRDIGQEKLLQITAPISHGSSGGPILNEHGKVIGIAVLQHKDGQNLNFAIPVSYLSKLMREIKPVKELDSLKKNRSVFDNLTGGSDIPVIAKDFMWDKYSTKFYYTIQNKLKVPVKEIRGIVILYNEKNEPIDFGTISFPGIIPGGLAKTLEGKVPLRHIKQQTKRTEIRILDFRVGKKSNNPPDNKRRLKPRS